MFGRYLTDQELEVAMYVDTNLELDYVDPDSAASSSESEDDEVEQVLEETENDEDQNSANRK